MSKLLLVASSGGHLFQMYSLEDFWSAKKRQWVSFKTSDAEYLLQNEDVTWANFPTNRNLKNLVKNFFLAWKIIRKQRPTVIMSTGAGIAVPFIVLGKFFRVKTIYLESITRSEQLSLSGRLVYYFADKLLVQWPELAQKYKRAEFKGRIL